ncbi:MAG: hypothetical protein EOP09_14875, partial [Proteobacteria bacterium]
MISCAAISDIHNDWDSVELALAKGGDILFIAGDLTYRGAKFELEWALDQISTMRYTHKIVIAGNHDTYLQSMDRTERAILFARNGIRYLEDDLLTLSFPNRRLTIYGTPWTLNSGEFAFQGQEEELARQASRRSRPESEARNDQVGPGLHLPSRNSSLLHTNVDHRRTSQRSSKRDSSAKDTSSAKSSSKPGTFRHHLLRFLQLTFLLDSTKVRTWTDRSGSSVRAPCPALA